MGFMDKIKSLLKGKSGQVKQGVDKAGDMVDKKTGGKYSDKIDMAQDKITKAVDKADEA